MIYKTLIISTLLSIVLVNTMSAMDDETRALIARLKNFHQKTEDIHGFANLGATKQVKKQLKKGVPIDTLDATGGTALHHAAIHEHVETVELLIKEGANVNIQTQSGITPLHDALSKENTQIVKMLLDAGARVDLQDNRGLRAVFIADTIENEAISELFLPYKDKLEQLTEGEQKIEQQADMMELFEKLGIDEEQGNALLKNFKL